MRMNVKCNDAISCVLTLSDAYICVTRLFHVCDVTFAWLDHVCGVTLLMSKQWCVLMGYMYW